MSSKKPKSRPNRKMPTTPPMFHFEYCLCDHGDLIDGKKIEDGALKSIAINDLWLYFYQENLIGIRHQIEQWSYYIDPADCAGLPPEYVPPSAEKIHPKMLEIISRDFGGDEKRKVYDKLPYLDISKIAIKLIGDELVRIATGEFGLKGEDAA